MPTIPIQTLLNRTSGRLNLEKTTRLVRTMGESFGVPLSRLFALHAFVLPTFCSRYSLLFGGLGKMGAPWGWYGEGEGK
jgi:hypothetical protein